MDLLRYQLGSRRPADLLKATAPSPLREMAPLPIFI
jgi:hypothetical protein